MLSPCFPELGRASLWCAPCPHLVPLGLLANPRSPPHSLSPFPSPLPPLPSFNITKRRLWSRGGSPPPFMSGQRTLHHATPSFHSRQREPCRPQDQGHGRAEHSSHTCTMNCSAALFEAGNADQRSPGRLWPFVLIAGAAFQAHSVLPCDVSLPQVFSVFSLTSPALHLQGKSAQTEDDIGLLRLPDLREVARASDKC